MKGSLIHTSPHDGAKSAPDTWNTQAMTNKYNAIHLLWKNFVMTNVIVYNISFLKYNHFWFYPCQLKRYCIIMVTKTNNKMIIGYTPLLFHKQGNILQRLMSRVAKEVVWHNMS